MTATMAGTRLKDKVILVTGSGTGIGEGMARRFIAEGARVMLHDKQEESLPGLVSDLGENTSYVIGDLEDSAIPARLIEQTVAHFGRIDGLVNNAAVKTRGGIEDTDEEAFDRTVNVNLKAPFFLIRAAIPHFRRQGGGRVLNIGSINAYCGEIEPVHLLGLQGRADDSYAQPRRCPRARGHPGQPDQSRLDAHAQ